MIVDRLNGAMRRVPSWVVYVLLTLPMPWFFYLAATGQMGVEPIKALEHKYGEIALQLLIAGLVITPLRRFANVNLLKHRRAVGVMAFFYVAAHLAVWLVLDVQIVSQIWADILKRPYITIGMVAFALLLPLALTSNTYSVRKLGARWRQLHRLTYAAVLLGGLHFIWLAKGIQLEPLLYMTAIVGLLLLRMIPATRRRAPIQAVKG